MSYVEDLETTDDRAVYSLPLSFSPPIPSFEMNVSCDGTNMGAPELDFGEFRRFPLALSVSTAEANVSRPVSFSDQRRQTNTITGTIKARNKPLIPIFNLSFQSFLKRSL